jgi:hypothetical protein
LVDHDLAVAMPSPRQVCFSGRTVRNSDEFLVRRLTPNRLMSALLVTGMLLLALPLRVVAQDTGDTPLGDVARNLRKKTASGTVIDNDNLSKVVDDAQSQRAAGTSPARRHLQSIL